MAQECSTGAGWFIHAMKLHSYPPAGMKISQGRTCTDLPLPTMLQNSFPAWNNPSPFVPHTFLALLPVAPGVGQGLTSFGEVPTQNAAGLGYRWAGQSPSLAGSNWPRSQCGSTSGVHTRNLWGHMLRVSVALCTSFKEAELCGWVLMKEAMGPAPHPAQLQYRPCRSSTTTLSSRSAIWELIPSRSSSTSSACCSPGL